MGNGRRYLLDKKSFPAPVVCDFRLPPRSTWELRSSGTLRSYQW